MKKAILAILIAATILTIQQATASVVLLKPVADSYVNNDNPNTNYGAISSLVVKYYHYTTIPSSMSIGYLRFDLSEIGGLTIEKAYLSVNLWTGVQPTGSIGARYVSNDAWNEYTITWNNAPAMSTTVRDKNNTIAPKGRYYFDVTSDVKASINKKTVSFALTPEDGRSFYANFDTRETSNPPYLAIVTPNKPPSVEIIYPGWNDIVGDVVTIRVSVEDEDNDKLDLDLKIDGKVIGTTTQTTAQILTYNWDTSTAADGTHTIKATVSDGKATHEHQINVIVNNQNLMQQIQDLGNQLEQAQSQLETIRRERDTLKGQVTTLQGQVTSLQNEKTSLETQIRNLQGQVTNLQNEKIQLEGRLTTANTKITNLENELASTKAQITTLGQEITRLTNELKQTEAKLETTRQEKATLETEVANLNDRITILKDEIDSKTERIAELVNQADTLTGQVNTLTAEKEREHGMRIGLEETVYTMNQTLAEQADKIQERDERINEITEDYQNTTREQAKTILDQSDQNKKLRSTGQAMTLAIIAIAVMLVGMIGLYARK